MRKAGQTWRLGDEAGGETIATILKILNPEVYLVLVLRSTIPGCNPGTTEKFSASWFSERGSLLSKSGVR